MDLLTAIEVFGLMDTSDWSAKEKEAYRVLCLMLTDIIAEFMDERGIEYSRTDLDEYLEAPIPDWAKDRDEIEDDYEYSVEENTQWLENEE